jgi:DNA repair protein RadA/Sms
MAEKSINVPLVEHTDDVRTLKNIKVPDKFFSRMKMDVPVLDEIFGGQDWPGILPGTSVLFTGMPGAGKSTAALQFADLLVKNASRNILYNVGEENEYMVKMRADRLGIDGNFGLSIIEDVDALIKVCKETGVEVLFQDSLQSLRIIPHCEKHELHDRKCKPCENAAKNALPRAQMLKAVTKKLHRFAKEADVAVWIIGHITKGGDFAGPMEVKHDVDVHAHIRLNPDTMAREFSLTKNRFGPAGIPYECNLTAKGLNFATMKEAEVEEKKGGSTAAARREKNEKMVKDSLLKGDQVSAYDIGKFPDFEGAGGTFRAILEKVVSSLQAEGHIVSYKMKDARKHYFVEV